jgi:branched-chain amino acid transport system ATP-binding protein
MKSRGRHGENGKAIWLGGASMLGGCMIFGTLTELCNDGRTIMLVEQNARSGLGIAHNGAILEAGTVRLAAPAAELLDSPDVGPFYLGAS